MKNDSNLKPQEFERLLDWLTTDKDSAGRIYLELRAGLNRFFQFKGCHDTEQLTDKTLDRVAKKLAFVDLSAIKDPFKYCYGFAKNVNFEFQRMTKRTSFRPTHDTETFKDQGEATSGYDPRLDCLDECVNGLSSDDSDLVLAYYEKDRGEKVRARRELAENLKISFGNLVVRVSRVREKLRICMEICLRSAEEL